MSVPGSSIRITLRMSGVASLPRTIALNERDDGHGNSADSEEHHVRSIRKFGGHEPGSLLQQN